MVKVKEHQPHGDGDSGYIGRESEVTSTDMKLLGLNMMGSMNHTESVEWVESPIRTHTGLVLPEVDKKKERGEPPIPIQSKLAFSKNNQHKEWVESPIRTHDKNQGVVQVKQNRQDHIPASSKCYREIQEFGISMQEAPLQHSGFLPDSTQQAFMNFEVSDTSVSPCAEPVPVWPPGCMQRVSGIFDNSEQQNLSWFIVSFVGSLGVVFLRHGPDINARCTGFTLLKNEVFSVCQEIASPDGRIYLCLADGRGWAFDDSALAPEDPSVVRMDFGAVRNPIIPWQAISTLQHGEQAQIRVQTTGNTSPHHLESMASSCVRCTYPIDVSAKFCIICGEKQPSPRGIVNPMCEVHSP